MKDNTLRAVKSIDIDQSLLQASFVQETLATGVSFAGKPALKRTSFGLADLRNIQRKKRPVRISTYDKFL